jgi:hypothetical protein
MRGWLAAFLVTQAVEVPIYLVGLRGVRRSAPVRVAAAFGASAVTHPVVWFAVPALFAAAWPEAWPGGYVVSVAVAEAFAVAVEALGLNLLGLRRAWLWSLVANAASTTIGLTSRGLTGWP